MRVTVCKNPVVMKRYRAISGVAAIVSWYRTIWGHQWEPPSLRLGISGLKSGRNPERPWRRTQSPDPPTLPSPDHPFHAFFFPKKKRGLAQKMQFLSFCPFSVLFWPSKKNLGSPVLEFSSHAFFVQTALFGAPKCALHYEKSMGRKDTKKTQETKKTQKGGLGLVLSEDGKENPPKKQGFSLCGNPKILGNERTKCTTKKARKIRNC